MIYYKDNFHITILPPDRGWPAAGSQDRGRVAGGWGCSFYEDDQRTAVADLTRGTRN